MAEREVAREDLCRAVPFTVTRAASEGSDGLTLEGYGAVFNAATRIDSWEGTFDETIAPGAFKKSLRERTPRLQFDHGTHPLIGSLPIGRITDIAEDDQGLRVAARLSDNWLVEPVRDAIADGTVDGMSFRFSVVRDEWADQDGSAVKDPFEIVNRLASGTLTRTLKEVKVSEVGPVVWPAYEQTSVGVRSKVTIDLGRLNDPGQRATLARAVMLADAAERATQNGETAPPATDPQSADEHAPDAPPQEADTPQPTEEPSAGEHTTEAPNDTPQPTGDDTVPAGEHESGAPSQTPNEDTDADDEARSAINAALLEMRDSLALTLNR